MRVLFADSVGGSAVTDLEARGHTCVLDAKLQAGDLANAVGGFDALVVRSTKVGREVFETADRLALVIRAGAGTNTIDTEAAAARGVLVANLPGRNAAAVAELTMGLLLAVDRRIVDGTVDLRAGHWDKKTYSAARGLLGSTMGILGLGSIGLEVAQRARAFGIDVRALAKPDRSADVQRRAADLRIGMAESLSELLPACDIVSLHLPSSPATVGLVDESFLAQMKPGSILLNTSRGELVDEDALLKALDDQDLRAGLDVFADEPGSGSADWSSPLAQHPRVVGTHHIGASTQQAQDAIAAGVVEIIDAFVQGETPNCVNLTPEPSRLRHPHRAAPGPGRRPRPRPGPAEPRRPQRGAHGEPDLLRRERSGRDHRRRRVAVGGPARRPRHPAGRPRRLRGDPRRHVTKPPPGREGRAGVR